MMALGLGACTTASSSAQVSRPPEIRTFLEAYFSSWSQGDMDTYEGMFFPRAQIMYLGDSKIQWSMALGPFIESQRRVHKQAKVQPIEKMTSFTAELDDKSASVTAKWALTTGRGTKVGVDRFILAKDFNGDWRIVSLVFYYTEPATQPPNSTPARR